MMMTRSERRGQERQITTRPGRRRALLALALAVALLLAGARRVEAHKPVFPQGANHTPGQALPVADVAISWAFYTRLGAGHVADYYRFEARRGQTLYAQIVIPRLARYVGFGPGLALVGPGLPRPAGGRQAVAIPAGMGLQTLLPTRAQMLTAPVFHESFSNTDYWVRQTLNRPAPRDGTYYLVVFEQGGGGGKYCLAVGQREEFSPGDLLNLPALLGKLRAWFS